MQSCKLCLFARSGDFLFHPSKLETEKRKLAAKIVLRQAVSQDNNICLLFLWFCKEIVWELNRLYPICDLP